jgi:hypothetical protein
VQKALHELYTSVLGQDIGLHAVLRQVVATAMGIARVWLIRNGGRGGESPCYGRRGSDHPARRVTPSTAR